jgi:hypothetical protein
MTSFAIFSASFFLRLLLFGFVKLVFEAVLAEIGAALWLMTYDCFWRGCRICIIFLLIWMVCLSNCLDMDFEDIVSCSSFCWVIFEGFLDDVVVTNAGSFVIGATFGGSPIEIAGIFSNRSI